jgi:hypothetical protein
MYTPFSTSLIISAGRHLLLARVQRYVRHALELHALPGIGVAAALRLLLADDVRLVADHLVVDQHAVLDQVPALGLDALVVVADGAERVRLHLVGEDRDLVGAVLEVLRLPLVQRDEARARVVGLVAEHAVELERVADRLVDGEPKVRRVEHQVVLAGLDRRRLQLLLRLLRGRHRVLEHVVRGRVGDRAARQLDPAGGVRVQVLVAHAHRGGEALAAPELAGGLVDGGDRHRGPDAVHILVDVRLVRDAKYFCSFTRNRMEFT